MNNINEDHFVFIQEINNTLRERAIATIPADYKKLLFQVIPASENLNISIILPNNTEIKGTIYHGINNKKIKPNHYYQIQVTGGETERGKLIDQIEACQELEFTVNLKNRLVKIKIVS